jgi:isoleucyl-tRNA synthetase
MLAATRSLGASWSSTLRLPKSPFPPRPLPEKVVPYLRRCTDELYSWQKNARSTPDATTFTLHDGPPYANGPLHVGHALNKITKDVICRFELGQGKRISYIPGWDCHGLPIEIKALQAQKKDAASTDAVSVREAARELATATVEQQMRGFKEWAVMGDWDKAYKTMERDFEIRQLEVCKTMFEKGLIYRQFKPVYWSPSSRTALAEAELEYDEGHKSLAAYVRFPLLVSDALKKGAFKDVEREVNVVIWTTTPWTLPANKAIAVHTDMEYCIVEDAGKDGELTLVAASRVEEYQKILERPLTIAISGVRGSDLAGQLHYENPFQKANGPQPIIHADFVTDSSGTGLVHLAPGHGMDDYHVCSALGLPAFAPIDDAGAFTKEAFPEQPELLEGLPVADIKKTGTNAVCNYLDKLGLLRGKHNYRHKYPIDWRTKEPVVVRATEQWFANVENIKDASMKAIEDVKFHPESGRPRLESFIQGRSQWCISRQRAWGVPIPALYKVEGKTLTATMDSATIQHLIDVIKERGINAWWTDAPDDAAWKPSHLDGTYVRGRDTMDVWFDSGTSWTLLPQSADKPVADVYLEGTDQHRGWFQSSLLTHVATQPYESRAVKAPYKTLITHGFTLDAAGRKMSKSLGNVISPAQIMSGELLPPLKRKKQKGPKTESAAPATAAPSYDAMGPDALRLWAASSDYTRDVTIGQPVLASVNQALHKYRVTFKWLLGIFSLPSSPPPFSSFAALTSSLATSPPTLVTDTLALHRLAQTSAEVHAHYAHYDFSKGLTVLNKYIATDLSAFYFETLKDRIYTGPAHDVAALQRVLGAIFYELLHMLSPVVPLLVEEVWDHVPAALRENSTHPARAVWAPCAPVHTVDPAALDAMLAVLGTLGAGVKAAQERLRAAKKIGSSLESAVTLHCAPATAAALDALLARCTPSPSPSPPSSSSEVEAETNGLVDAQLSAQLAAIFVTSGVGFRTASDSAAVAADVHAEDTGAWAWSDAEEVSVAGLGGASVRVQVHPPPAEKCPRCWRFVRDDKDEVCGRCRHVVGEAE